MSQDYPSPATPHELDDQPVSIPIGLHLSHLVLLVDQEPKAAVYLRELLEPCRGIGFHYCHDPVHALHVVDQVRPTVIVIGWQLRAMGVFSLLRLLRANPATVYTPLVVAAETLQAAERVMVFSTGVDDYLEQSMSPQEVVARLRHHSTCHILRRQRDEAFEALKASQKELEHRNIELLQLSQQDGLTGLGNKRYFVDWFNAEWRRARREKRPLALLLVDVDHFKEYNDSYGHLQGDACLTLIAHLIRDNLHRASDLAARIGGEEFAVILAGTDQEGAACVANQLRQAVAAAGIPHATSPVAGHVTISVGVAALAPVADSVPETLFQLADQRLYRAKRSGRNTVIDCDREEARAI